MPKTASQHVWPKTLVLPERPPRLVYLDLLHWVSFAQALTGHARGGPFREVLDACLSARGRNIAVFPIADAVYMETAKIRSHRRRRDLADVIELLSAYTVVTSRVMIARHEVEALLDHWVGPNPRPITPVPYLDWGVARAFGRAGGFQVSDSVTGEDATAGARALYRDGPAAFDAVLARAELELNHKVLEGPTAAEEPELRLEGWDPRAAYAVATQRAKQEAEQAQRLRGDPSWRGPRLRRVVTAREVLIEINSMLYDGLKDRGEGLSALFSEGDPDAAERLVDSMPSFDVSVSLKTAYHQNPDHRWTPNHIQDIDALASTVPYCDVVATDREAASQLRRSGVADRLRTVVLEQLEDLPELLTEWAS